MSKQRIAAALGQAHRGYLPRYRDRHPENGRVPDAGESRAIAVLIQVTMMNVPLDGQTHCLAVE